MNILKYLRKSGFDTVESSFYSKIMEWEQWYLSNVPRFHRYRIYQGSGQYIRCNRLSLKMAKKLSEDIADLLLNERVTITLSDAKTDVYVKQVLTSNNFLVLGNEFQERKAYCGTVAYVPSIRNMTVDAMGRAVNGEIGINYITAKDIFPISWSNGRIKEVAFLFRKTYMSKKYLHLEIHRLNADGTYYIENRVLRSDSGETGAELTPYEWEQIPFFKGLVERVETASAEPQFVVDKLNIVNNASDDETNPMGIAIFANAIDTLRKLDLEYDSYANEFLLGRKRIFVSPEMLRDHNGNPVFDPDDSVFYTLPEDALKNSKSPLVESNMTIRVEEHSKAINDDLNYLSFKCGFGTQRYKFENGNITTATQVISENSDMYRSLQKHEIVLESVIKQLIAIIIRLGNVLGAGLNESAKITIDFDDSIIEDKETERKNDRQDVSMGVMGLAEYRAKYYGETEEVAASRLPEQRNEVME